MLLTPGLALALVTGHAIALINDPRSHGFVGDDKLSLNEAIRLHNGSLTLAQLSPAEVAQLLGGSDLSWAELDASITPRITVERDLDVITDSGHGFGFGGASPVEIALGNTRGVYVESNFCDLRNVTLSGGTVGVRLVQTNAFYGSSFQNVHCRGQRAIAFEVVGSQAAGRTALRFESCTIERVPIGISFTETAAFRTGGIEIFGSVVRDVAQALSVERGSGGNFELRIELCDLRARQAALSSGPLRSAGGVTVIHSRLVGSVEVAAGTDDLGFWDTQISNGALRIASTGALVALERCVLEGVEVFGADSGAWAFEECRFVSGSIDSAEGVAMFGARCHLSNTRVQASVVWTDMRPGPQLATCRVMPLIAPLGTSLELRADVPPGFTGLWIVGVASQIPSLIGNVAVYTFAANASRLPYFEQGSSTRTLTIPVDPGLRDLELCFHLLVAPAPHAVGLPMTTPPGCRVVLR